MSSTAKVVQEDTHKNVDEKTILCNSQEHLKSSKHQFLEPAALLGKGALPEQFGLFQTSMALVSQFG
jgi:hypothetical protein